MKARSGWFSYVVRQRCVIAQGVLSSSSFQKKNELRYRNSNSRETVRGLEGEEMPKDHGMPYLLMSKFH